MRRVLRGLLVCVACAAPAAAAAAAAGDPIDDLFDKLEREGGDSENAPAPTGAPGAGDSPNGAAGESSADAPEAAGQGEAGAAAPAAAKTLRWRCTGGVTVSGSIVSLRLPQGEYSFALSVDPERSRVTAERVPSGPLLKEEKRYRVLRFDTRSMAFQAESTSRALELDKLTLDLRNGALTGEGAAKSPFGGGGTLAAAVEGRCRETPAED